MLPVIVSALLTVSPDAGISELEEFEAACERDFRACPRRNELRRIAAEISALKAAQRQAERKERDLAEQRAEVEAAEAKARAEEESFKRMPRGKTTAAKMVRAYKENEIGADVRFKGKPLEVSGRVFAVGRDVNGNAHVALFDGVSGDWLIRCFPGSEGKLAELKSGQRASLHGTGEGLKRLDGFNLLTLGNCEVK